MIFLKLFTFAILSSSLAFAQPPKGLDVNDVAILFPLDQGAADTRVHLELGSPAADGRPFLDPKVFEKQIKFITIQLNEDLHPAEIKSYAKYRIVALRFDPCASTPHNNWEVCEQELRLTAQSFSKNFWTNHSPQGGALHLSYRLGTGRLNMADPVIQDLLAIREASSFVTSGKVLGVHPGLAGNNSEMAIAKLRSFIQRWATSERLVRVTFSGITVWNKWVFSSGTVKNGTEWTADEIANTHGARLQVSPDPWLTAQPLPWVGLTTPGLFLNYHEWSQRPLNEGEIQVFHQLSNPTISTMKNRDCVSCHSVSMGNLIFRVPFAGGPAAFVNPKGITGFVERATEQDPIFENLGGRANHSSTPFLFGYEGNMREGPLHYVRASSLVANAAARSAAVINEMLGFANPSEKDCSNPKIRECFAGRIPGFDGSDKCLSLCVP